MSAEQQGHTVPEQQIIAGDMVYGDQVTGDKVGGDKIAVGDIGGSYNAIGAGAQVIVTQIQQALSAVDEMEKGIQAAERRLAAAIQQKIGRYANLTAPAQLDIRENPYKALLDYKLEDAPFFYGRSQAVQMMWRRLANGRLTILHSESGSGKTSLLQAGLAARLLADGHFPLYLRPYRQSPDQFIKKEFLPDYAAQPELSRFRDDQMSLKGFLERAAYYVGGRQIYIFLDQFEEFFTEQSPETQRAFAGQLQECVESDLPVRWVLSLRKEYFSDLRLFGRLRPFDNEYFLPTFRLEEAQEVVTEPAVLKGVQYEGGLVDHILSDLRQEDKGIPPAQVQLVCYTLFDELESTAVISHELYDKPRGRGAGEPGAKGILTSHLTRVLDRELKGAERRIANRILEELVTSDVRRAVRSREHLAAELETADPAALEHVLTTLHENRLIRRDLDEDDQPLYELTHDYLLSEIELNPETQARKAAKELLARQVIDWRTYGALMQQQTLRVVSAQREALSLDEEAQILIGRSALTADIDLAEWLAYLPTSISCALLLDGLADPEPTISIRAARHLVDFFDNTAETHLVALYERARTPDLRGAALGTLARHRPGLVRQLLLETLDHPSSDRRRQAARGLQHFLDAAVVERLFTCVAADENEGVWQQALTTLAKDAAEPYVGQWQSLRKIPFVRKAAVYDKAKALHIPLFLPTQASFAPAVAVRYTGRELRERPVWSGIRLIIPVLFYITLAFWQGWWPFWTWQIVDNVPTVSFSSLAQAPDGGLYVGSWDYGLGYLSPDGEWAAWRKGNLPTSTPADFADPASDVETLEQLAVDPIQPDRLYAAVYEAGVWLSDDGGWNWVGISAGQVPTDVIYLGLAVHDGQLLLATSFGFETGSDSTLYSSHDSGQSWQNLAGQGGLPTEAQFTSVAFDRNGTAYVGTEDSFFVGNLIAGEWQWRELADVPGASHIVFGSNPDELFLSFSGSNSHRAACLTNGNLGQVLEFSRDSSITAVTAHPTQPGTYYLAAESIYRVDCNGNQTDLKNAFGVDYVPRLIFWTDATDTEWLVKATVNGLYQRKP